MNYDIMEILCMCFPYISRDVLIRTTYQIWILYNQMMVSIYFDPVLYTSNLIHCMFDDFKLI